MLQPGRLISCPVNRLQLTVWDTKIVLKYQSIRKGILGKKCEQGSTLQNESGDDLYFKKD